MEENNDHLSPSPSPPIADATILSELSPNEITEGDKTREEGEKEERSEHKDGERIVESGRVLKRTNAVRKKSEEKPLIIKISTVKRSHSTPDILEGREEGSDSLPPPLPPRPSLSHVTPPTTSQTQPPLPPRCLSREDSSPGPSPLVTSTTAHTHNEFKDTLFELDLVDLDKKHYDLSPSEDEIEREREGEKGQLHICQSLPVLSLSPLSSSTNKKLKKFSSFPSNEVDGYSSGDEQVGGVNTEEEEESRPHPLNNFTSSSSHVRLHNQELLNELFFKFNFRKRHRDVSTGRPRQRSATETSLEKMGRASDMICPHSRDFTEEPSLSETEDEQNKATPTDKTTPTLIRPPDDTLAFIDAPIANGNHWNDEDLLLVRKQKKKLKKIPTNYSPRLLRRKLSPEIVETRKSRTQSVIEGDLPKV